MNRAGAKYGESYPLYCLERAPSSGSGNILPAGRMTLPINPFRTSGRALALLATLSLATPAEVFAAPVFDAASLVKAVAGASFVEPTAARKYAHGRRSRRGVRPEAALAAAAAIGVLGLAIANANRRHHRDDEPVYGCDPNYDCPAYGQPEYVVTDPGEGYYPDQPYGGDGGWRGRHGNWRGGDDRNAGWRRDGHNEHRDFNHAPPAYQPRPAYQPPPQRGPQFARDNRFDHRQPSTPTRGAPANGTWKPRGVDR